MEDCMYVSSDDDECCNQLYNDDDSNYDYDDESLDGFVEVVSGSNAVCGMKASSCKVIRKESLLAAQKEDLQRVMDLLSLKEHHARTLLIHYRWDVIKILAVLVERGGESLYAEAGLTLERKDDHSSSLPSTETTCLICFEDAPADKTTVMDCNHRFCNECWTTHFIVNINEGKSKRITCMAHKCNAICDEGKIRDLVTAKDANLGEKFDRFMLESYIEDNNKRVKWCPSIPHCGNAIRIEDDEYCCEVECACGVQFCFNCLSEVHSPCSCLMWELWMRKCKDDSATINWMNENAKHCPKCHNPVEKNGGCNLVRCKCGQPFCWLCGGATGLAHTWDSIAGHSCGSYKEGQKKIDVRKDLLRYTHFYERYMVHCDSLKVEVNMKEKLDKKVSELEAKDLQSKDFSWVKNGFNRLLISRRILSCSYPVVFHVFGPKALFDDEIAPKEREIRQHLFENLQQQLEINVERLSMFLEEPFSSYPEEKLLEIRMKIITLSTVTDNLCIKLYDCIENDLLVNPLQQVTHTIARYKSSGVDKATELPSW